MHATLKLSVLAAVLAASGCAAGYGSSYPYQYTAVGAATGALIGGVLGHQIDDDNGRYAGAATGALIGGMIGNNRDQISRMEQAANLYPNYGGYSQPSGQNTNYYSGTPYPAGYPTYPYR